MRGHAVVLLAGAALAGLCAPAAAFDKVLLKDGRTIEGTLVAGADASVVRLKVKDVEIPIPAAEVEKTFPENLDGFKPKTKEEEEFLKKGWVLFEGRWLSKAARDDLVAKRKAADKAAVDDIKKKQNWKNAVSKDSTHFTIKSNADAALVDEYLGRLEEFFKYFTDEWGVRIAPTAKSGKLSVELYRSIGDLLTIGSAGGRISIGFNGGDGDILLIYFREDPDSTLRDLYETASKQLIFYINPKFIYPAWIRDGLASYYSTATRGANGKLDFGAFYYGYVQELERARKDSKIPPLMSVLDYENTKWTYLHSAVEWSFIHFLLGSPKYGDSFRAFVGNLPNNKEIGTQQLVSGARQGATVEVPDLKLCAASMSKRLGAPVEKLEAEWRASLEKAVPMTPEAYFLAGLASLEMATEEDDDEKPPPLEAAQRYVQTAFDQFAAADQAGCKRAYFYRRYAELLRKGGIVERTGKITPRPPDGAMAFTMIQKAIALAPTDPFNYVEAAGCLLVDGPAQDLDKCAMYADVARAVAGPRDLFLKSMADEIYAKVEPAREARRKGAEAAVEAAATDMRKWYVAFYYVEPAKPPENMVDQSTQQVRDLIRAGKVGPEDSLFQSWRTQDPQTGELLPGTEPWDTAWIKVKDCPVFADDLAAAPKPSGPGNAAAPKPAGGAGAGGG